MYNISPFTTCVTMQHAMGQAAAGADGAVLRELQVPSTCPATYSTKQCKDLLALNAPVAMKAADVQVGKQLLGQDGALLRELQVPSTWSARDSDQVAWLAQETIQSGHSILIFCSSKKVRPLLACLQPKCITCCVQLCQPPSRPGFLADACLPAGAEGQN